MTAALMRNRPIREETSSVCSRVYLSVTISSITPTTGCSMMADQQLKRFQDRSPHLKCDTSAGVGVTKSPSSADRRWRRVIEIADTDVIVDTRYNMEQAGAGIFCRRIMKSTIDTLDADAHLHFNPRVVAHNGGTGTILGTVSTHP